LVRRRTATVPHDRAGAVAIALRLAPGAFPAIPGPLALLLLQVGITKYYVCSH
jgi:hypothetical protein